MVGCPLRAEGLQTGKMTPKMRLRVNIGNKKKIMWGGEP